MHRKKTTTTFFLLDVLFLRIKNPIKTVIYIYDRFYGDSTGFLPVYRLINQRIRRRMSALQKLLFFVGNAVGQQIVSPAFYLFILRLFPRLRKVFIVSALFGSAVSAFRVLSLVGIEIH